MILLEITPRYGRRFLPLAGMLYKERLSILRIPRAVGEGMLAGVFGDLRGLNEFAAKLDGADLNKVELTKAISKAEGYLYDDAKRRSLSSAI